MIEVMNFGDYSLHLGKCRKSREKIRAEISKNCRKNGEWGIRGTNHLVEGRIIQHPELNILHPDAVNTLRFVTISDAEGICLYIRFPLAGSNGSAPPNGHTGGIGVGIGEEGIQEAFGKGSRLLDYKPRYGSEHVIAEVPGKPGIPHEQLFLSSGSRHSVRLSGNAWNSLMETASNLKTEYPDLDMFPWPHGNYVEAFSSMPELQQEALQLGGFEFSACGLIPITTPI